MLRLAPIVAVAVLAGPVLAGLAGVLLPAFGYLPALGGERLSLLAWRQLVAQPGLAQSVAVSLASGLLVPLVALGIVFLFLAGGSGTRLFALIRGAMSPLLAVPHAAAAFGLAFLIAPSGLLARLASPWLTGWLRPPDLLIVQDPAGLAMMLGLVVKEVPFLLLMSLAALPQLGRRRGWRWPDRSAIGRWRRGSRRWRRGCIRWCGCRCSRRSPMPPRWSTWR